MIVINPAPSVNLVLFDARLKKWYPAADVEVRARALMWVRLLVATFQIRQPATRGLAFFVARSG
jgi:hypothetical protein